MNCRGYSVLFWAFSASIFLSCVVVVLLFGVGEFLGLFLFRCLPFTISNSKVSGSWVGESEGEAEGRRLVGLVVLVVREFEAISSMESYVSSGSGDMGVGLKVVEFLVVFFSLMCALWVVWVHVSRLGSRVFDVVLC